MCNYSFPQYNIKKLEYYLIGGQMKVTIHFEENGPDIQAIIEQLLLEWY